MRYKLGGAALATIAAAVSLAVTTPWASGTLPHADLTVRQGSSVATATPGATVTFKSLALDLGPSSSSLFDTISWTRGLTVTDQTCQLVSPDTPSCEWNSVRPNVTRTMTVQTQITGAVGTYAAMTVCASNGGDTTDSNAVNNCSTTFVRIVSP
jgi:hypothetical protein